MFCFCLQNSCLCCETNLNQEENIELLNYFLTPPPAGDKITQQYSLLLI